MRSESLLKEVREWCQEKISKAVNDERERCAVLLDYLAENAEKLAERGSQLDDSISHDMSVKVRALRSAAGRIRAGEEGKIWRG